MRYEKPDMELIELDTDDVIRTSPLDDENFGYGDSWGDTAP